MSSSTTIDNLPDIKGDDVKYRFFIDQKKTWKQISLKNLSKLIKYSSVNMIRKEEEEEGW